MQNRAIKFKGKRLDNGNWAYGDLLHSQNRLLIASVTDDNGYEIVAREVIPETVGQFTGCCDVNGTPIYEGDLVTHEYYGGEYTVVWDADSTRRWAAICEDENEINGTVLFIGDDETPCTLLTVTGHLSERI